MTFDGIAGRLHRAVAEHAARTALHEVRDGRTRVITYTEVGRRLRALAAALEHAGAAPGQALIVRGEGPDALVAELAAVAAGYVVVPVPDPATALSAIAEGVRAAGLTPAAVIAAPGQGSGEAAGGRRSPLPRIGLTPPPGAVLAPVRAQCDRLPASPALLLLTPDGPVTLTHGQIGAGLDALAELLPVRVGRRVVAHVPQLPAPARALAWHALLQGAQVCHVTDAAQFDPRQAVVLVAEAADFLDLAGQLQARDRVGLRRRAQGVARDVERARAAGRPVSWAARARHGLLEATVLAPSRAAVGRPAIAICCADRALPQDVLDAYFAAGLPVYQAFAPPRSFGPLTCNVPRRVRFATLGTAVPGVELTVADGRVRARAPWLPGAVELPGRLDDEGYLVPGLPAAAGAEPDD